MYKKVFAPDGKMFEVPQHVFDDVILNKGWTQTKPTVVPIEKPKKAPKTSPRRDAFKDTRSKNTEIKSAD